MFTADALLSLQASEMNASRPSLRVWEMRNTRRTIDAVQHDLKESPKWGSRRELRRWEGLPG
jgi:hypothetical protein